MAFRFPRLTEEQSRKICWASLEILERVGVRLFLDEAIDLLKKAGARVTDGNLVHLPSHLIEKALSTVPKKVVLFDRYHYPAMPIEGDNCFYGPGSDCLNIVDLRTGIRRKPILNDVREGLALCNALLNIDFVMSLLLPIDVNTAIADRYQMEAMLSSTIKPIIFGTHDFEGCVDCVEMAETVAGGEEALREKPSVACCINVVSGLRHHKEGLEKLLYLASKNLPVLYIPSSTAGVASPSTPAGSMALDYAGVFVGLTLAQLKREGTPVIVTGIPPGHLDMKTLVSPRSEPERGTTEALSHFYKLPMFSVGGASESKIVDQQAAAEAALSLLVETLAGANIIHDLGSLESGLTFSLSQLAICDEIVSWIKAFGRDIEVDDEGLALDVIAEVGPDGQFLHTEHTIRHYRERWYPEIFERETHDAWVRRGGKSLLERAQERVGHVLADHKVEDLPRDIKKRLRKIIQRAEKKVKRQ